MSIRIKDCIFLGRPKIGQDRVENVLAVDRSAPFGTRLLAAWTAAMRAWTAALGIELAQSERTLHAYALGEMR